MTPNIFPDGYLPISIAAPENNISDAQLANLCRKGEANGGVQCIKATPRLWLVNLKSLRAYNERIAEQAKEGHLRGRRRQRANQQKTAKS